MPITHAREACSFSASVSLPPPLPHRMEGGGGELADYQEVKAGGETRVSQFNGFRNDVRIRIIKVVNSCTLVRVGRSPQGFRLRAPELILSLPLSQSSKLPYQIFNTLL